MVLKEISMGNSNLVKVQWEIVTLFLCVIVATLSIVTEA